MEKRGHHRNVKDLEKHSEPQEPPENAGMQEKMAQRLKTEEGREIYKQRRTQSDRLLVHIQSTPLFGVSTGQSTSVSAPTPTGFTEYARLYR